jgi:hypothetical protein
MDARELLYQPYVRQIGTVLDELKAYGFDQKLHFKRYRPRDWLSILVHGKLRIITAAR